MYFKCFEMLHFKTLETNKTSDQRQDSVQMLILVFCTRSSYHFTCASCVRDAYSEFLMCNLRGAREFSSIHMQRFSNRPHPKVQAFFTCRWHKLFGSFYHFLFLNSNYKYLVNGVIHMRNFYTPNLVIATKHLHMCDPRTSCVTAHIRS